MTTVFPTHTAFDDIVELLAKIIRAHPDAIDSDEFLIVNGIIAPYGKEISHAWIEANWQKMVLFVGIIDGERVNLSATIEEYYSNSNVKETTKYTIKEAIETEKRLGPGMPWVEKYRALCRDAETKIQNTKTGEQ